MSEGNGNKGKWIFEKILACKELIHRSFSHSSIHQVFMKHHQWSWDEWTLCVHDVFATDLREREAYQITLCVYRVIGSMTEKYAVDHEGKPSPWEDQGVLLKAGGAGPGS